MRKKSLLRGRSFRIAFEQLEARELLCGDAAAHAIIESTNPAAAAIVASHDSDGNGHLSLDQFESLGSLQQNQLDPHLIDDPRFEGPIDFDALLGKPGEAFGPEVDALPDFFPQLDSAISVDQTTQFGRTLIRFGTQVNNQGAGPAILISGRPGVDPIPTGAPISSWVNTDGSQNVLQAIYSYNGSSFSLSRYVAGGRFTFHSGHGHFHYDGYAYYRLRHNTGGQPGDYVVRNDGTGVVGEKTGFCLINTSTSFIRENGQSSSTLPGYGRPGQPSTGCGLLQGIHVGYADEYSSNLSGQWLDVTGVPNGQYFLEISLDGENAILETDDANNAKSFAYTLNVNNPGGGIAPDVFDTGTNNNTFETATDMGVLGTFTQTGLSVHWGLDYDYFKFVASSSGTYSVVSTPASGNIDLYVYDSEQRLLSSSTNDSGADTTSVKYVNGATYYVKAQTYNSSTSSNYQIAWNLKPLATSFAGVTQAQEGGRSGSVIISRNGPTTSPLTVNFTLTGTAVNGVDFVFVPGTVTLGNLQSEARIDIIPIQDDLAELGESVILTITSNNAYVLGATGSRVIISDARGPANPFPGIQPPIPGDGSSSLLADRRARKLSIFDSSESDAR